VTQKCENRGRVMLLVKPRNSNSFSAQHCNNSIDRHLQALAHTQWGMLPKPQNDAPLTFSQQNWA